MRPMKLLLCAIRTASLTDMERRPLLCMTPDWVETRVGRPEPRSLHNRTGSGNGSVYLSFPSAEEDSSQFGCFQFKATQMSGL